MAAVLTDIELVVLVTAGLLSQATRLRMFVRDWRWSRAQERARRARYRTNQAAARHGPPKGLLSVTAAIGVVATPALAEPPAASTPMQPATGTAHAAVQPAAAQPAEATPGSAVSVQLNLDVVTAYFYRGINQEDCGLIVQPAAKLTLNLHDADGLKVDALVGTWNSFHSKKTGATTTGDFTQYWYESDIYAGLTLTAGKLSFTTTYTVLTSPSDAYETVQELGFTLALDDSEWLGAWALKPYAMLVFETGADGSDGANLSPGTYLELGIGPGFSFDVCLTPWTVTFPIAIGLSLNDYYQNATGSDDTFGYASLGARLNVPLPMPERTAKWSLNAGVSLLILGDNTRAINNGNRTEVIGLLGVQWNF